MIIKYKSKRINVKNVKRLSEFGKGIGLMFHHRKKCLAMLFEFDKPTMMRIHSLFVFFPFVAVWLDYNNKVIDLKIIRPFRLLVSSKKPFYKLIEIPLNEKYKREIRSLFR